MRSRAAGTLASCSPSHPMRSHQANSAVTTSNAPRPMTPSSRVLPGASVPDIDDGRGRGQRPDPRATERGRGGRHACMSLSHARRRCRRQERCAWSGRRWSHRAVDRSAPVSLLWALGPCCWMWCLAVLIRTLLPKVVTCSGRRGLGSLSGLGHVFAGIG
jgi:hypothetical protein